MVALIEKPKNEKIVNKSNLNNSLDTSIVYQEEKDLDETINDKAFDGDLNGSILVEGGNNSLDESIILDVFDESIPFNEKEDDLDESIIVDDLNASIPFDEEEDSLNKTIADKILEDSLNESILIKEGNRSLDSTIVLEEEVSLDNTISIKDSLYKTIRLPSDNVSLQNTINTPTPGSLEVSIQTPEKRALDDSAKSVFSPMAALHTLEKTEYMTLTKAQVIEAISGKKIGAVTRFNNVVTLMWECGYIEGINIVEFLKEEQNWKKMLFGRYQERHLLLEALLHNFTLSEIKEMLSKSQYERLDKIVSEYIFQHPAHLESEKFRENIFNMAKEKDSIVRERVLNPSLLEMVFGKSLVNYFHSIDEYNHVSQKPHSVNSSEEKKNSAAWFSNLSSSIRSAWLKLYQGLITFTIKEKKGMTPVAYSPIKDNRNAFYVDSNLNLDKDDEENDALLNTDSLAKVLNFDSV